MSIHQHIYDSFKQSFESLRRKIDNIPLTSQVRMEILQDMNSMKKQMDDALIILDRKKK